MADEKKTSPAAPQIIDFSNVKDRGDFNPKHKPEGDYKARVTKVISSDSQAGNPMWTFAIQLDDDASATYPHRCVLNEANIWKVRNLLVAAGLQVPKKKVKVDPQKVVGKFIGITLEDDEYEGKLKSVVQATFPVSDLSSFDATPVAEPDLTESDDADETDVTSEELEELEVDEL